MLTAVCKSILLFINKKNEALISNERLVREGD
jgi:hypothetical protein